MNSKLKLITLDPGHFHAALVQKSMFPEVDSTVYVYAPEGPEVQGHLNRIRMYNTRQDKPTGWNEQVYLGPDFLSKMLADKSGNVVVISGNNLKKTEYISKSVQAGLHVLADKPMAINTSNFELLRAAFEEARKNNVQLYDIMTERYEITNMLQRELSMIPEIFGTLEKGTPDAPAVTKESVHHFYKYVSGQVLVRPAWFMDVAQQGEGLTDITTHLVDLVQWECFPDQALDYQKDIHILRSRRWPTEIRQSQFNALTRLSGFPEFLKKDVVKDSVLRVFSNGEILYRIKDVCARVSVTWAYQAPDGTGDTHYSIMRGTASSLIIRQGVDQHFEPTLYIESPKSGDSGFKTVVLEQFQKIGAKYPGVALKENNHGWEVIIPEHYREGHEAHFTMVAEKFLGFVRAGKMPDWEAPNMMAKYYTTTQALKHAETVPPRK